MANIISFSGAIKPYLRHCPYCYYLLRVMQLPTQVASSELQEDVASEEETSAALQGVHLHQLLSQCLQQHTLDDFPHLTSTLEYVLTRPQLFVEQDISVPLEIDNTTYQLYARIDAYTLYDENLEIFEWKFGKPFFSIYWYQKQLEYYTVLLSFNQPISRATLTIHFPIDDYTPPVKVLEYSDILRIQQQYLDLIDTIHRQKIFKPQPMTIRCQYCPYRSTEAGGTGACDYTVV